MNRSARPGRRARQKKAPGRSLFLRILILLVLVSLVQYLAQGEITWPVESYQRITQVLREYANQPGAGWRQAADKLEELGAAREGRPGREPGLAGRVVRVADGDTLSLLERSGQQHTIRLFGIDTPERDQPHGTSARTALSRLVSGKTIEVVTVETDDYGRTVGTVYLDDTNINLAMIERGHAWWYRRYAPYERHLAAAEETARRQGLGLWSAANPVPPWNWRRARR